MKLVIAGADVIDGSGSPAQPRDVYIEDGTITAVAPHADVHSGWDVIDAAGLTVTPGFVDVHSHADYAPFMHDDDTSKILQGVTTEIVGNCGFSFAPSTQARRGMLADAFDARLNALPATDGSFAAHHAAADRHGYVTNVAPLVGHAALRIATLGMDARRPTPREAAHMRSLLDEALDAGAFGLSTGLIYPPSAYADTEEVVALAERLRPNTLYASHMRSEANGLLEAVAETIAVGERARVRVQISHHKAAGRPNWGKTRESLAMIAAARARGVDVYQDVYPYVAGSTMVTAVLPPAMHEGGAEATLARLRDESARRALEATIANGAPGFENLLALAGYDGILIATTASGRHEGMTLTEIARSLGIAPFDALVHVLVEERLDATMTIFLMNEDDVERVLADPFTAIGTDGGAPGMGGKPHPRLFGTFPRVLGRYVRERGTISLASAVHKMSGLPAHIFGLTDRGTLANGKIADIVAFDAATVNDDLDYRDPVRSPKGLAWVMQRGRVVARDDRYLGPRRGERLRPARV